jgi:DNA polymerase-3 subunit epsilon
MGYRVVIMPMVASPSATDYQRAPPPGPGTPWREARFCVIDLELTGLDPAVDSIVSFAALPITGGRLRLSDLRYQLIRPDRMPEAETIRIHGLRRSDLVRAPTLSEVLDALLEALTGTALVAHMASVEKGFLDAALQAHGLRLSNPVIDTAGLAAELLRRRGELMVDPVDLSSLARSLGLPVHRPHHADGDALTTGQAFLALASHLDAFEPQTVGSLEAYGDRVRDWSAPQALRRLLGRLTRPTAK